MLQTAAAYRDRKGCGLSFRRFAIVRRRVADECWWVSPGVAFWQVHLRDPANWWLSESVATTCGSLFRNWRWWQLVVKVRSWRFKPYGLFVDLR